MNIKLFCAVFMFLTFNGCGKMIDTKIESENLLNTDKAFASYSQENGAADAFNRYLLPEALQLPNGREPLFGRDTIYALMSPDDDYQLLWDPISADVSSSGDMGYTWGTYTYSYVDKNGDSISSYGKYLNIWKKDCNNDWKVLVDMGNSSPQ